MYPPPSSQSAVDRPGRERADAGPPITPGSILPSGGSMSTVANGVISRRRFLTGLAAAGIGTAAGGGWFARRPPPPGLPEPAASAPDAPAEVRRAGGGLKPAGLGAARTKTR